MRKYLRFNGIYVEANNSVQITPHGLHNVDAHLSRASKRFDLVYTA